MSDQRVCPEYKVEIFRSVSADGGGGSISRILLLPFVPYPGLRICLYEADIDGTEIRSVVWLPEENRFVCKVDNDQTSIEWQVVKECYLKEGWTVD
jgi:hypothetical protein